MQDISNDVIIKAQEGDIEAFEAIYKTTAGFVYNVCLRVLYNKEDAEEAAQEAYLTIYRKIKSFRFEASFKTWVYRIAVNLALNFAKKRSRRKMEIREYDYAKADNVEAADNTEEAVYREERQKLVEGLLNSINPKQRVCVVLRDIEGLSYEEIARALRVNINTVRSRLRRARERLLALGKKVDHAGLQKV